MGADISLPQDPPVAQPKGQKLPSREPTRYEIVSDIVVSLAISALAIYLSPTAYVVGVVGSIVERMTPISRFVEWVGQHPEWKQEFYYPVLGEVLSGVILVTALTCGIKAAAERGIFCTIVGYYAPPILYHRIYPLVVVVKNYLPSYSFGWGFSKG